MNPFPLFRFNLSGNEVVPIDLSGKTIPLPKSPVQTHELSVFIQKQIQAQGGKYGIGGYLEDRGELYGRGEGFTTPEGEMRCVHLGVDVWAPVHTPVFSPGKGKIHSFKNNDSFGNYGGTIVLELEDPSPSKFLLFGHLSVDSLRGLKPGQAIFPGDLIGTLGTEEENVGWPPHLHLQCIQEMGDLEGDFPGVAPKSELKKWTENCPNPEPLLKNF